MGAAAAQEIVCYRRQMLVHCCLYYHLDQPVIDDHTWFERSHHLATLQAVHGWHCGFYDTQFEEWEGSSGHHLHYDADVERVALRTLWAARRMGVAC